MKTVEDAANFVSSIGMKKMLEGMILFLNSLPSEDYILQLKNNLNRTLTEYENRYSCDVSTEGNKKR